MALITCLDCRRQISDAAPACPHCGRPQDMQDKARQYQPITEEIAKLIFLIVVAHDGGHELWSRDQVLAAERHLTQHFGSVPKPSALHDLYRPEEVQQVVQDVISSRRQELQAIRTMEGVDSPCHLCGSVTDLTRHVFGMSKVLSRKLTWDWSEAGVSAAVSAIALPLVGVGRFAGPGVTTQRQYLRMNLVVCASCLRKRRRLFGVVFRKKDYRMHPWFENAKELGFTKVLDGYELPRQE